MKIGVIGAGSTYTPELVEGLLRRQEAIGLDELTLMDIDDEKLAVVGGLARRMVERAAAPFTVRLTTERLDAIRDAAFVLTQMRVGRLAARRKDELIPRQQGFIGQETTGPGGFAKALRTIPVILQIAREMEEYAPGAIMINFTNPAGLVTEAVLTHSGVNAIGLCNGPLGTRKAIVAALGARDRDVSMRYFGLNHLSFAADIALQGRDVTDRVIEALARDADATDAAVLRALRMVPSNYLQYYYRTAEKLEEQRREERSRAEQVMEIEEQLLALYRDPDLTEKPAILEKRGGGLVQHGRDGPHGLDRQQHGRRPHCQHTQSRRHRRPTARVRRRGGRRHRRARGHAAHAGTIALTCARPRAAGEGVRATDRPGGRDRRP